MPHEFPKTVPIQLTEKGLFLLDLNNFLEATGSTATFETHQVSDGAKTNRHQSSSCASVPNQPQMSHDEMNMCQETTFQGEECTNNNVNETTMSNNHQTEHSDDHPSHS